MTEPVGRPAYVRVAGDLRSQIADGRLSIGDPIPSSSRLREIYGVSSTVVRAAVAELRAEGLVRGQPGKAVYVRATPNTAAEDAQDLAAVAKQLERLTARVDSLPAGDEAADSQLLREIQREVRGLTSSVEELQSAVVNLYNRLGMTYPEGSQVEAETPPGPRAH